MKEMTDEQADALDECYTKDFTEEYVPINGIEQYLLHYCSNAEKVVIMLHGGPGIPNSYIAYYLQPYLDFCNVVYYDQRGSGKTQLKNKSQPKSLTLAVLLEDLKQTVKYVKEKYQTDKVILCGHSWGSVLGTQFVIKYPQDVIAYIGYGQAVDSHSQEKSWYEHLKTVIVKTGNEEDIKQ